MYGDICAETPYTHRKYTVYTHLWIWPTLVHKRHLQSMLHMIIASMPPSITIKTQSQSINRNQSIAIKTIASMPPPSESRTPKINMFAHNPARPLALFSKGGGRGGRGPLVTRDLQRPKAYYHRPRTTLIYFEAFGGHPAGSKTICMRGGMSRYRSKTIHTRKQKRMHIRQLGVLAPSLLGLVQTLHGISIYRRFIITSKTI